jgi:hypothetical protein
MSDWAVKWPQARPRWATYSVKAHQDLGSLIADLLTYDVLVFPCPEDDDDFSRWEAETWDPELLALRVNQLGDHAVAMPWDHILRDVWRARWRDMPAEERHRPAAFELTAAMMAELPLTTLMDADDDRLADAVLNRPTVHPAFESADARRRAPNESLELVAAFQAERDAVALTASSGVTRSDDKSAPYGADNNGLRVRMQLEVPESVDETTLFRTLDLVQDEDFQIARRRLWSWEQTLPRDPAPADVAAGLEALIVDYNAAIRRQAKGTRRSWVFLTVPALVGAGLDAALTGGLTSIIAGLGVSIFFDRVKARFPSVTGGAERASHHPGSAVTGMLAIAGHTSSPKF